nr:hypothetical protein Iba_chr11eCG8180 [Ipomoea batatas]
MLNSCPLKWFIFHESQHERHELLKLLRNFIVSMESARIRAPEIQGFYVLPVQKFPGETHLPNIYSFQISAQFFDEACQYVKSPHPLSVIMVELVELSHNAIFRLEALVNILPWLPVVFFHFWRLIRFLETHFWRLIIRFFKNCGQAIGSNLSKF